MVTIYGSSLQVTQEIPSSHIDYLLIAKRVKLNMLITQNPHRMVKYLFFFPKVLLHLLSIIICIAIYFLNYIQINVKYKILISGGISMMGRMSSIPLSIWECSTRNHTSYSPLIHTQICQTNVLFTFQQSLTCFCLLSTTRTLNQLMLSF